MENISISRNYLVKCTGTRALIYDSELQLIQEIGGLNYCYKSEISPDERNLLLVSNENKYWVVSLKDYLIRKVVIKGKYNGNIEGEACWSFDGSSILVCVTEKKAKALSSIRRYKVTDLSCYDEYLNDKYCLICMRRINIIGEYLLIGYERTEEKYYMIWYDGITFKEYKLDNIENTIFDVEYDASLENVILYCNGQIMYLDIFGEKKQGQINCDKDEMILLGKYIVRGTREGIFIAEKGESKILVNKKIKYGAFDIKVYGKDKIIVSTVDGIKIFSIEE